MKYAIVITRTAQEDIDRFHARWQSTLFRAMREHLEHEPKKESKSRIKRLRGLRQPQYRLRVDKARIYYDVDDSAQRVEVLGLTLKEQSAHWLSQHGGLE
jgi:mRNA interferase RelE/StbE